MILKKYIFLLYSINEERTKEMCLLYLKRTYKEEVFITVKENVERKSFESYIFYLRILNVPH